MRTDRRADMMALHIHITRSYTTHKEKKNIVIDFSVWDLFVESFPPLVGCNNKETIGETKT